MTKGLAIYIAVYLEKQGFDVTIKTPRNIFRVAGQSQILTDEQVSQALEMLESRNQTTHIYKEEFAEVVAKRIPIFCLLMQKIMELMKP